MNEGQTNLLLNGEMSLAAQGGHLQLRGPSGESAISIGSPLRRCGDGSGKQAHGVPSRRAAKYASNLFAPALHQWQLVASMSKNGRGGSALGSNKLRPAWQLGKKARPNAGRAVFGSTAVIAMRVAAVTIVGDASEGPDIRLGGSGTDEGGAEGNKKRERHGEITDHACHFDLHLVCRGLIPRSTRTECIGRKSAAVIHLTAREICCAGLQT